MHQGGESGRRDIGFYEGAERREGMPYGERRGCLGCGGCLGCLGGLVVLLGLVAAVIMFFPRCEPSLFGSEEKVREGSPVVDSVRRLARLEATSFHMEQVIEVSEQNRVLYGLLPVQDAVLLVVAADVVAGVDLSKLEDEAFVLSETQRDGETLRRVTLRLPPPEVLAVTLDESRTFVHARHTDLLAKRAPNLEQKARKQAVQTLRDAAIQAGILERAKRSSEQTLQALIRSLGVEVVDITWTDEER